jgi:chloride channel 3/4/5
MWKSFTLAMIAAVSLQLFNPFETGKLVLFQVSVRRDWFAFELPFFIFLGVCGGLIGAVFIKLVLMLL